MMIRPLLLGSTAFVLLASSNPAVAQATSGADAADPSTEIIVTARKRAESALSTPLAVTALTADDLTERSIGSLTDASNAIPNVSFTSTAGDGGVNTAVVYIRGIGQNDYANSADPGVGTYIDGVYLGSVVGGVLDLPDIAQLEVLRGPQGTLFGKNTMGGAINITTKSPADRSGVSVMVTGGSRNRFNTDTEADLRFNETLGLHAALATRHQDGFVERLNGGSALGEHGAIIGRAKLEWTPNDRFTAVLAGDYSRIEQTTPRVATKIDATSLLASIWNGTPFATQAGQFIDSSYARTDLRTTNASGSYDNPFRGGGGSLRLEYEASDALTIRSISAYRTFRSYADSDQDGQSIYWGQVRYRDGQDQVSQEFNLLGTVGRLEYIVGLYYFNSKARADQNTDIAFPLVQFRNYYRTQTDSYAAFAQADYALTDRLGVTLGARYTTETKNFYAFTQCRETIVDLLGLCNANGFYVDPTTLDRSWDSFDPRIGLQYELGDNGLLYASYATGFKSGGFNARANNVSQLAPYNPENLDAFELGAKGRTAGGRLTFSAAAFRYDYKQIQVTATGSTATGAPVAVVGNAGDAELTGFEVEATARVTNQFTLNGSVGYVDAKYTSLSQELNDFFAETGQKAITLDSALPKTPEWTVTAGAQFVTPIGNAGSLTLRADYAYVSKQFSDVQNFAETLSPAHSNVNARIAFAPDDERWEIAAYGKNLTDETYIVNAFYPSGGSGAQVLATPNVPRELGIQLSYRWGR